jgi:uncharacterized cupin superfamily protein
MQRPGGPDAGASLHVWPGHNEPASGNSLLHIQTWLGYRTGVRRVRNGANRLAPGESTVPYYTVQHRLLAASSPH